MKTKKEIMWALLNCKTDKCNGNCPYFEDPHCIKNLHQDAAYLFIKQALELNERKETGKTLNDWAKEIHDNAVEHGWWEEERSFGEIVALCHSELSEALEAFRDGKPLAYQVQSYGIVQGRTVTNVEKFFPGQKIEGIAVEMIDCLIRILDWCGKEGVDVDELLARKHAYNKGRPYRHGGKKL